jgi:hypothetical protein
MGRTKELVIAGFAKTISYADHGELKYENRISQ